MRVRCAHQAVLGILFVCQFSVCLGKATPDANDTSKYLNAVRTFADNVLKYGRDTYGPKHTPLFVDGLNTETLDPVVWRNKGEKWILSNFANHQSLLRLLDGLTALTGEGKYRQAAVEASAYALTHLRTRNGLLYWGGHLGWDLQREKGVSEGRFEAHELREQLPYYELLWEANPSETKRLMETIWGAHVLDWSKLDFNRHSSSTTEPRPAQWAHEFDENLSCPFPSVGNNWSMANIAGSLLHTGASLAKLGEHREALIWTKRLAQRWRSARHPLTGLCGGLLSVPQEKRAYKFLGHKHPNISDATMIAGWLMDERYRFLTICEMQVGEELGDDGLDLIRWASDDLKAFSHYAYDEESLSFRPLLTDGTELNWREFQPGYYSPQGLAPLRVSSGMLWAYTTAYRLTRDPTHWKFLRNVWRRFDLGDLGTEAGDGRHLNLGLKATSCLFLYACLDLHTATEDKAFLILAQRVADNILAARTQDRCLPKDCFYVRTGDEAMLAVLHLAAVLQGKSHKIPQPKVDRQYFHCAFSGAVGSGRTETDARVWDDPLFYNKRKEYSILPTGSTEPPISIREAISMGNMEIVRVLYAQRTDFENMHSLLFPAVQSSHKDAVEFFLTKGADVNSRNGWQEETPLHHAVAVKDGIEMIELLIDKGADLNAKNWKGDTPLRYAAYYDHEKISELLLQKGAKITNLHIASYMGDLGRVETFIKEGVDINARDGHGYVPLHYAARERQKQAMELLVTSGADLDVKNWEGKTPFAVAMERGHKDVAELLLNKGANVNSADNEGSTLLHRAVRDGQRDMAAFLIDKGADVNAKNDEGQSALVIALNHNRKDIFELLLGNGAEASSIHVTARIGDLAKVKKFLESDIDVNAKDTRNQTALHYAAREGHKEIVEFLLSKDADVNAGAWYNRTAAEFAMGRGHTEIVELLISKGADVSPLNLAIYLKDEAKAKSLIEGDADVNKRTPYGTTPLNRAAGAGFMDIVRLLLERGADVNTKDNWDWTPLHSAIYSSKDAAELKAMVELLIAKGADVNAKDGDGRTPLWYAQQEGHTEIVELLKKHGTKE